MIPGCRLDFQTCIETEPESITRNIVPLQIIGKPGIITVCSERGVKYLTAQAEIDQPFRYKSFRNEFRDISAIDSEREIADNLRHQIITRIIKPPTESFSRIQLLSIAEIGIGKELHQFQMFDNDTMPLFDIEKPGRIPDHS